MNMTLTAALFVGGESRRMGTDKATLIHTEKPLWAWQLDTLRNLRPDKILISARLRPIWAPMDIEVVLDESPSQGPLSGLVGVLKQTQTTHILALAIDLPKMTTEHLRQIWNRAQAGIGVIPQWGNYYEPLVAIYPAAALSMASQSLIAGQLSLQLLVETLVKQKKLCIYSVDAEERHLYLNVNSPEDMK
jgi:molybdopterin-guanine dinucleotide biosynthesis protein A